MAYTLTISINPSTVFIGQTMIVSGNLSKDGSAIPSATIDVQVNGTSVGTPTTIGNGSYSSSLQFATAGTYSIQSVYTYSDEPIGAIIPLDKSLISIMIMPEDDWIECNGQTISDPASPLDGQVAPNLNGENRFLRGNTASGTTGGESTHTLTAAEMPAHSHSIAMNMNLGSGNPLAGNSYGFTTSTGSTGGDGAHENKPPFYEVVWIMKIK